MEIVIAFSGTTIGGILCFESHPSQENFEFGVAVKNLEFRFAENEGHARVAFIEVLSLIGGLGFGIPFYYCWNKCG